MEIVYECQDLGIEWFGFFDFIQFWIFLFILGSVVFDQEQCFVIVLEVILSNFLVEWKELMLCIRNFVFVFFVVLVSFFGMGVSVQIIEGVVVLVNDELIIMVDVCNCMCLIIVLIGFFMFD